MRVYCMPARVREKRKLDGTDREKSDKIRDNPLRELRDRSRSVMVYVAITAEFNAYICIIVLWKK